MSIRWMTTAAITVVAAVLLVFALVPLQTMEVRSSAEHEFLIDRPMERVRKILVRTNSIKTIVAMADARLKDQQWLEIRFENDDRLLDRDWELSGDGQLEVVTRNGWLGEVELQLDQSIKVRVDRLESTNQLASPAGPVRDYDARLLLTPDGEGKAHFATSLQLVIQTRASWFTRGMIESRIRSAAKESLVNQESALRQIVEEHDGKLLILPGPSRDDGD